MDAGFWFKLMIALAGGLAIGWIYFWALWWTVRRITRVDHPVRLGILSFVVRSLGALAGFYALLQMGWVALAVGLVGFVVARFIWTHRLAPGATETEELADLPDSSLIP